VSQFQYVYYDCLYVSVSKLSTWQDQSHISVTNNRSHCVNINSTQYYCSNPIQVSTMKVNSHVKFTVLECPGGLLQFSKGGAVLASDSSDIHAVWPNRERRRA